MLAMDSLHGPRAAGGVLKDFGPSFRLIWLRQAQSRMTIWCTPPSRILEMVCAAGAPSRV